jgi:Rrf2 family transcriptional regulator, nitric oxide-sensitive transcriptional repressor
VRLTLHADYGLRTLVYLATHPRRIVPTTEIGRAYGISKNHLVRVAQSLRDGGFIELTAGRAGGLSLARAADTIKVGDVVRTLEPDLRIVECFDAATNTCPISPVCGLSRAIDRAVAAFLTELDRFTIGDAVARSGPELRSHFLPVTSLVRRRGNAPAGAPPDSGAAPPAKKARAAPLTRSTAARRAGRGRRP